MKPFFIAVEGADGVGKTTLMPHIEATICELTGLECYLTRDPGGSPMADSVRAILKNREYGQLEPLTILLLMAAQRHEKLSKVVMPALVKGHCVLSDRFSMSTKVYQMYMEGLHRQCGLLQQLAPEILDHADLTVVLYRNSLGERIKNPAGCDILDERFGSIEASRLYQTIQDERDPRYIYVNVECALDEAIIKVKQAVSDKLTSMIAQQSCEVKQALWIERYNT
jgi:dTMP kinase